MFAPIDRPSWLKMPAVPKAAESFASWTQIAFPQPEFTLACPPGCLPAFADWMTEMLGADWTFDRWTLKFFQVLTTPAYISSYIVNIPAITVFGVPFRGLDLSRLFFPSA